MKNVLCILLAVLLLAVASLASAESLYVDNRETDKVRPERLNLRSEPSSDGGLLGLYYTGTQVAALGTEGDYTQVEIAGVKGYMASEYLITLEEAKKRYGDQSAFLAGRTAQLDLHGLWKSEQALLSGMTEASDVRASLRSGDRVALRGIVGSWAYVSCGKDDQEIFGYLPLEVLVDVDAYRVMIVAGEDADSQTNLYAQPGEQAKPIMALKNGTSCVNVFGRTVGQWHKVRVGGVTGYIRPTQTDHLIGLGDRARSAVPYYPLVMQTRGEALLYSEKDEREKPFMTLGQEMRVEVLAESGEYVYVRTLEGGVGTCDSGDYGYMRLDDLTLAASGAGFAVAQVDDDDLPGLLLARPDEEAQVIGALCCGAQVRITSFTQTDYAQVSLGDAAAYLSKDSIRMLSSAQDRLSERIPLRATVIEACSLRGKPEASAKKGDALKTGERVYMLGRIGQWAYVRAAATPVLDIDDDSQDRTGFVPLSALNAPAGSVYLTAKSSTDKVNIREKPDKNGAIVGKVRLDEQLLVTDYGTQWTGIVTPEGKRGYVMTEYLVFE